MKETWGRRRLVIPGDRVIGTKRKLANPQPPSGKRRFVNDEWHQMGLGFRQRPSAPPMEDAPAPVSGNSPKRARDLSPNRRQPSSNGQVSGLVSDFKRLEFSQRSAKR